MIVKGKLDGTGLYKMEMEFINKEAYLVANNDKIHVWHQRLGHPNYKALKAMGFKGKEPFCETCQISKSKKKPFKPFKEKTNNKLETMHVDLCGPMKTKGMNGETYFLAITDETTDFTVVHTFRTKQADEIGNAIQDYITEMERQFNAKVKKIVMDGGKEFVNRKLTNWLTSQGIIIKQTNPYTPEQNGVSERKNETLVETARAMIKDAGLPQSFWSEAILTAAYTRNRVINRKDKKSPYERLYGNQADLNYVKIFGARAYAFIDNSKRTKWDDKAYKTMLIGYTNNGYKLLDMKTRKIIYSRNVTFNEQELGFGKQNTEHYDTNEESESEYEKNESDYEDSGSKVPSIELESDNEQQELNENQNQDRKADEDVEMRDASRKESDEENEGVYSRTRGSVKRRRLHTAILQSFIASQDAATEPQSYEQAILGPDKEEWKASMNEEINSLLKNETWELVALPEERKAIENKWVFRVKRDKNGIEIKKKSRLVIKGFRQKYGIDYKETFAPVVQMQSLRPPLALSVINNWKSFQVDVKTAFLYGTLEEDIYMKQPKGFIKEGQEHLVCKLKKSLYGLKQAPRVWHEEIKGTLISIGFKQCTCDNGIFVISDKDRYMVLAMWVDDMPIFYENESDRKWLLEQIRSKYEIEESELEYILGIKIEKEKGRLKINQTAYIEKKVEEYGLADSKETTTPMIAKQNLEDSEHEKDDSPYRELIGSIMHSMVYTRPDISYAVSILSRSLGTSTKGHFEAAKRVLKYLKTTKNLAIEYSRPISNQSELEVYVDSADAAYPHFGYVIKLAGGAISWKSTKSKLSTLSSTELEYIALSSVTQEVMWIRELFVN